MQLSGRRVLQAEDTTSAKALRSRLLGSHNALQILAIHKTKRRQKEGKGCFCLEGQEWLQRRAAASAESEE